MGYHRLVLVPQLPVRMRYQEWWGQTFELRLRQLAPALKVVVLGQCEPITIAKGISHHRKAIEFELLQMKQYVELKPGPKDILLHLDLSYPGLFHSLLMFHRPGRAVCVCHATSKNHLDLFGPHRKAKWPIEKAHASLYDRVIVASNYHAAKVEFPNLANLGALPDPPFAVDQMLAGSIKRNRLWGSVARDTPQKRTAQVEKAIEHLTNTPVERQEHTSWGGYFRFLRSIKFLVITSKEETYGYQVIDAVRNGCVPIAPNDYSYPELLPSELLYDNKAPLQERAQQIIEIAKQWPEEEQVQLLNQDRIDAFWPNLMREIRHGID